MKEKLPARKVLGPKGKTSVPRAVIKKAVKAACAAEKQKPGYHLKNIEKGTFGSFSKIREELEEAEDAIEQKSVIMELTELSDLYGAIQEYIKREHNLTMEDLRIMSDITQRAFVNGRR